MKNILITGSSGFIGKALLLKLQENFIVTGLDSSHGSITEKDYFAPYLDKSISHVFHLAAKTFVPDSWENTYDFYNINVIGTENVLEFCRKTDASLTYISAYIYGQPEKLPISETHSINPNNPYAHSKYLAEQLCHFYSREFNVKITVIRPFNIYGIGQDERFLIPWILKQALFSDVIAVKDIAPKRDYIYIDDFIDALVATIGCEGTFSIYNIGSGCSLSVLDIINTIQKTIGTQKMVVSENVTRKNELNEVVADIGLAFKSLNWWPKHTFLEGIEKIVSHMKKMYKNHWCKK